MERNAVTTFDSSNSEGYPFVEELSFGSYLRRERVLRGISKDEILRVTKVSEGYYDALEQNEFDRLPPKAFVVGLLRVVSDYAGLPGDEVVNRFLTSLEQKEAYEEQRVKSNTFLTPRSRLVLALGGFVSVVVLMLLPLLRN